MMLLKLLKNFLKAAEGSTLIKNTDISPFQMTPVINNHITYSDS